MSRKAARERPALSAQVIVRSKSGKQIRGDMPITADTLPDYAPAEEDVRAAQEAFARAGFEVGNLVGISFSITAPAVVFEDYFGTRIDIGGRGQARVQRAGDPEGLELPRDRLPSDLAGRIVTVTFSPVADLYGGGASMMS